MTRSWLCLALCVVVTGCNCGGGTGADGGTGGGAGGSTGGGFGGGSGGGTGGGVGGGGGGVSFGAIPFDDLCAAELAGLTHSFELSSTRCGQALTPDDVSHLPIFDFGGGSPSSSTIGNTLNTFVNCGPDGGFGVTNEKARAAIAGARMTYDPVAAGACRDLGRQHDGGLPADAGVGPGGLPLPCDNVLVGTVPGGGSCQMNDECAFGLYCRPTTLTSCGGVCTPKLPSNTKCNPSQDLCASRNEQCALGPDAGYICTPTRIPLNGSCTVLSTIQCDTGLVCNSGKCTPSIDAGDPCSNAGDQLCGPSAYCVQPSDAGTATCRPLAQLGEPCSQSGVDQPICADTTCSRCDPQTKLCTLLGLEGASCTQDGGQCVGQYYCGTSNTCTLKPRPNTACIITGPQNGMRGNCLYGDNFCARNTDGGTTGLCRPLPDIGQGCGDGFNQTRECANGYCNAPQLTDGGAGTGSCANFPVENEPCGLVPNQSCEGKDLHCANNVCTKLPGPGQLCDFTSCTSNAYCDPQDAGSADDLCLVKKPGGAACAQNSECVSANCEQATKTCLPDCTQRSLLNLSPDGCNQVRALTTYLLFAAVLGLLIQRRKRK
ncbi:MAG: hypothetical protein ACJ790_02495 [Myxococcaceae bacterium]